MIKPSGMIKSSEMLKVRQWPTPTAKQSGFTLIEIMVAVIIFGFIGVASYKMLAQAQQQKEVNDQTANRMSELQRAMLIMGRDFMQVAKRPVRDEFGDPFPLMKLESDSDGTDSKIEFSRHGWRNPLGFPRSNLQHIQYAYEDEQLIRRYWLVLDRLPDSKSYKQVIVDGVDGVVFEVIPELLNSLQDPSWKRTWPQSSNATNLTDFPAAVKITLKTQDMGDIYRIYALGGDNNSSQNRGGQGQTGAQGPGNGRNTPNPGQGGTGGIGGGRGGGSGGNSGGGSGRDDT
jgi:general secretion pathway protein J